MSAYVTYYPSHQIVTFHVLTTASMIMRAFWDTAPCILIGVDRRFRVLYRLHHQGDDYDDDDRPDDGGSTHLWKLGLLQLDYTALYPTEPSSSAPNPPTK
jgi:hypothetical protein